MKKVRSSQPSIWITSCNELSKTQFFPMNIVKENADIFSNFIYQSFNDMIDVCVFSTTVKLANITPVINKGSKKSKEYYIPTSSVPNISIIYKRCLFKQMSNYFENIFSIFQCGFRQGLSTHYCLVPMIEKWKKSVQKQPLIGVLKKRCSENVQQIYWITPMPKCDFNKVVLQL